MCNSGLTFVFTDSCERWRTVQVVHTSIVLGLRGAEVDAMMVGVVRLISYPRKEGSVSLVRVCEPVIVCCMSFVAQINKHRDTRIWNHTKYCVAAYGKTWKCFCSRGSAVFLLSSIKAMTKSNSVWLVSVTRYPPEYWQSVIDCWKLSGLWIIS